MAFIKQTIKEHTDALYIKVVGALAIVTNVIGFGVFLYIIG
jgi:hypothetical protein